MRVILLPGDSPIGQMDDATHMLEMAVQSLSCAMCSLRPVIGGKARGHA